MPDKLSEVGKTLGLTKKNAEAAIRRYQAHHPKIERIRDIFDDVVPFEMEFDTASNDSHMNLDLYFNKPPPMSNCVAGNYGIQCADFTVETLGTEGTLFQVEPYWPGTVSVFANNTALPASDFAEYDPVQGLVYVVGQATPQIIVICYVKITWNYICNETTAPMQVASFISNGNNDPEFGSSIYATNYTYGPSPGPFNAKYTTIADYTEYVGNIFAQITWTSHLGSLDNLPVGQSHITTFNGISFNDVPSTVNWENITLTMRIENVTGTHIGETLGFFSNPPEEANLTVQVGHTLVEFRTLYGDKTGIFPFFSSPAAPRSLVRFTNSGPRTWDYDIDSKTTVSPWFEFGFNEPTPLILNIHREDNHISVTAGGITYTFDDPRFGDSGIYGIDANWSATSWLTDTSNMWGSIKVDAIEICRRGPENNANG